MKGNNNKQKRNSQPRLGIAANDDRYRVEYLPVEAIKPSPENDQIYGKIDLNDDMAQALAESIRERGLEEPLILTVDYYILSGHRRFSICKEFIEEIPCRIKHDIHREGNPDYLKDLIAYNPQRIKSVGSLLREAILRDSKTLADTQAAIQRVAATHEPTVEPKYIEVPGKKFVTPISWNKRQFLVAVQEVVEKLGVYWPLSIRQIHYRLLNNPPLKLTPERSWYGPEKYRYRNDQSSYDSLSDLCTSARYLGKISWEAIDDSTRTVTHHIGFRTVTEFIEEEMYEFLLGYNLNKQYDQPIHIEVLVEKNTLVNIAKPIVWRYYVPMTSGRGFAGPSVWRKMAERFEESGKKKMALLILSDYDPEGLVLADDAIRSLRDLWELPVKYHRIGVTREQIEELHLQQDFNLIKPGTPNCKNFVKRTGGTTTWECEALEPEYIKQQIEQAIQANLNMEIFKANQAKEREDSKEIHRIRTEIARSFNI